MSELVHFLSLYEKNERDERERKRERKKKTKGSVQKKRVKARKKQGQAVKWAGKGGRHREIMRKRLRQRGT